MKNLSFFTKYTSLGATSRYRSFLFMREFLNKDYNLSISSLFDSAYLQRLYQQKKRSKLKLVYAYANRVLSLLLSSENLIIEYELFPYMPLWFEKLFLKNKNYILNFDDNVWDNYKNKSFLKQKYNGLIKGASGVIVANEYLYEKVFILNNNLIKIPTVIDLEDYKQEASKNEIFTIVWIGTPITYCYIQSHAEMFQKLSKRINYELCIVADEKLESQSIKGVNMHFINWSIENEVHYLKCAHVGIMPLDEDAFSQGKSAFKLIQYLGAGIPAVGSNIGENKILIQEGYNGFLPSCEDEWIDKLELLSKDASLREKLGANAILDAYEYSLQKYFCIYKNFVDTTFSNN